MIVWERNKFGVHIGRIGNGKPKFFMISGPLDPWDTEPDMVRLHSYLPHEHGWPKEGQRCDDLEAAKRYAEELLKEHVALIKRIYFLVKKPPTPKVKKEA